MWPMPSYLLWNLAILISNSSLGSEKLKQNRYSLILNRAYCVHYVVVVFAPGKVSIVHSSFSMHHRISHLGQICTKNYQF